MDKTTIQEMENLYTQITTLTARLDTLKTQARLEANGAVDW